MQIMHTGYLHADKNFNHTLNYANIIKTWFCVHNGKNKCIVRTGTTAQPKLFLKILLLLRNSIKKWIHRVQ